MMFFLWFIQWWWWWWKQQQCTYTREQTHRPVVYVLVLFYFNCVSCTCFCALAMNIFVSCYVALCVCVCTYTKNVFLYQRVHGAPVVSVRVVYICREGSIRMCYIYKAYIMVDFPKEQSYIKPIWLPFSLQYYARFSSIFTRNSPGKTTKSHVN